MSSKKLNISEKIVLPKGFKASGVAAGLKKGNQKDMALLVSEAPATVAGMFTTNQVKASTEKRNWKEIRGCLFSEIIKELGAEELGALFCEQDQALAEAYNPRISFTRFQTALTGGDCCDTLTELK